MILLVFSALYACLGFSAAVGDDRPNIVLIYADDK